MLFITLANLQKKKINETSMLLFLKPKGIAFPILDTGSNSE